MSQILHSLAAKPYGVSHVEKARIQRAFSAHSARCILTIGSPMTLVEQLRQTTAWSRARQASRPPVCAVAKTVEQIAYNFWEEIHEAMQRSAESGCMHLVVTQHFRRDMLDQVMTIVARQLQENGLCFYMNPSRPDFEVDDYRATVTAVEQQPDDCCALSVNVSWSPAGHWCLNCGKQHTDPIVNDHPFSPPPERKP